MCLLESGMCMVFFHIFFQLCFELEVSLVNVFVCLVALAERKVLQGQLRTADISFRIVFSLLKTFPHSKLLCVSR